MKYVMFETATGLSVPIVFPMFLTHRLVASAVRKTAIEELGSATLVSAGFFDGTKTHGISVSLGIPSRPGDGEIITNYLKGEQANGVGND